MDHLESISILKNSFEIFAVHCVSGITANENICSNHVANSTATATALISKIGYNKVNQLILITQNQSISFKQAGISEGFFTEEEYKDFIKPEAICKLGF